MGMSSSKKARRKAVREGKLNPEALRSEWVRKPYTQAVHASQTEYEGRSAPLLLPQAGHKRGR